MSLLVVACSAAALVLAGLRWLRVAQREHYVPGRTSRIAGIWLSRSRLDAVLAGVAAVLAVAGVLVPSAGIGAAILAAVLPRGLGVRGRTSPLRWTGRLRRLTAAWLLGNLAVGALLWWLAPGGTALLPVVAPLTLDAALAIMDVLERRLSAPFVAQAQRRLARIRPQVVAVTGSYGKTSTKGYIAHLLSGSRAVVASPASFNNRLGLSRAVNDGLVEGTEVFVAEMGAFEPGEIRELCALFPPDIAVITTVGEAHLERMRTHQTILAAKSEITERARTVVLPVDTAELAALAQRCRDQGKRVVTCSVTGVPADVVVDADRGEVRVGGSTLALGAVPHAVNLAVSVGVAVTLGVEPASLARRLGDLPRAAHRAEVHDPATGVAVIDDTYNANPVGARAALAEAAELAARRGGPLVVVTPGIVELGPVQAERNTDFAQAAAEAGARVVVVGRTNRQALLDGARRGGGTVDVVDRREQAVAVATQVAGASGVILYENDLPDHYP